MDCAVGNNPPIDKDAFIEFLLDSLEMASPIDRNRWFQIFKDITDVSRDKQETPHVYGPSVPRVRSHTMNAEVRDASPHATTNPRGLNWRSLN
jgi:hypothetical protein